MAEDEASFALHLEDDISGAASTAAGALDELRNRMEADTRALTQMQKAMKNLQSGSVVNVKQFHALKQAIDQKKQAIAKAQSEWIGLGGSFTKAKTSSGGLISRLEALGKQSSSMPGPVGRMSGAFARAAAMLTSTAAAAVAVVAVTVLLAAATAKLTKTLYDYGTAQAEARRNELLRLDALGKIRTLKTMWFGLKADKGSDLQQAIDNVSAKVPVAREKLVEFSNTLYTMGLRGKNFESALEGMSLRSLQGTEHANMFAGWAAGFALTGRNVDALTQRVRNQLGGVARAQMLSTEVQTQKLQEAYTMLFTGLKMEPLLKAKAEVNALFSQATASGRAMKRLLTGFLQPLIDSVTAVQPYIKRFFQGMTIAALVLGVAILKVRNTWRSVFGKPDDTRAFDYTTIAVWAGVAAFGALTVVLGALATALAPAVAAFVLVGAAVVQTYEWIVQAFETIESIDWAGLGRSIWEGFTKGLMEYASKAIEAVKGIGGQLYDALQGVLKSSSPSKLFAELGETIPLGVAVGIDKRRREAQDAAAGIVPSTTPSIPVGPQPAAASAAVANLRGAAGGGGNTVQIKELHYYANGRDAHQADAEDFKQKLERVLQGVVFELGGRTA